MRIKLVLQQKQLQIQVPTTLPTKLLQQPQINAEITVTRGHALYHTIDELIFMTRLT